ncbi:MAG TPA: hypothetical protein VK484_08670, partial [Ferruginibacter sp.]|nr:hypothetical protein [Ferruginibacter sp.]
KLPMNKYAANFNADKDVRKGKTGANQHAVENMVKEPDPVFNRSVMGHLKLMDDKLDSISTMTKKLLEKGGEIKG